MKRNRIAWRWAITACLIGCGSLVAAPSTTAKTPTTGARAAIVTIEDEINDITFASLKRRVDDVRAAGAKVLILEMDTPGGLVSSALDICNYLKNITDLKTIAWVRPSAYSAGAMISLACNEVVMTSASRIGDCAPIILSPTDGIVELGKTERAKAESPILKEFRDSAHRNHYDPLLCEAMVRQGSEIWWIERVSDKSRKFALKAEKEAHLADKKEPWRLVEKMWDPALKEDVAVRQPIVEDRDLLTLTQSEALAYGFSKAIVSNEEELAKFYGFATDILRLTPNWAEIASDFLSSPLIRGILMMLIALGVYAEFNAPGHFVGAGVALVALVIFLGAPYLTGLADIWEILLVFVGVILLGVEIFVIPGFGVAGIAGILFIMVGFIATFVPSEPGPLVIPRLPGTWLGLQTGIQVVFGGLGMAIMAMWLLNKYLPHMPGARNLFLMPTSATSAGRSAAQFFPTNSNETLALGDVGDTITRLRPAGKALFGGRRVDVITQGQMVDEGRAVEVIDLSGNRIVVRERRGA
jgi:membrane-bound serine protease (ClpP class)